MWLRGKGKEIGEGGECIVSLPGFAWDKAGNENSLTALGAEFAVFLHG